MKSVLNKFLFLFAGIGFFFLFTLTAMALVEGLITPEAETIVAPPAEETSGTTGSAPAEATAPAPAEATAPAPAEEEVASPPPAETEKTASGEESAEESAQTADKSTVSAPASVPQAEEAETGTSAEETEAGTGEAAEESEAPRLAGAVPTETGSFEIPIDVETSTIKVERIPAPVEITPDTVQAALTGDFTSLINEVENRLIDAEAEEKIKKEEIVREDKKEEVRKETARKISEEACSSRTNDTDGDGLFDAAEKYIYQTDCLSPDSDLDGRNDGIEVFGDMTDPLEPNKIEKVNVTVSNFVRGSVFTNSTPLFTGTAKAGVKVSVYLINENGRKIFYGYARADGNNHYAVSGTTLLEDGAYRIYTVDEAGNASEHAGITISTGIKKFRDVKFVPAGVSASADRAVPAGEQTSHVKIEDGKPTLSGVLKLPPLLSEGKEYVQLYAIWTSAVFTSTILADVSAGNFKITSPEVLDVGNHEVRLYLADNNVKSEIARIPFKIQKEKAGESRSPSGKKGWLAVGAVFVFVFTFAAAYLYRRRSIQ